jgi:hypothetical protein
MLESTMDQAEMDHTVLNALENLDLPGEKAKSAAMARRSYSSCIIMHRYAAPITSPRLPFQDLRHLLASFQDGSLQALAHRSFPITRII